MICPLTNQACNNDCVFNTSETGGEQHAISCLIYVALIKYAHGD